jgi:hypothetical protein
MPSALNVPPGVARSGGRPIATVPGQGVVTVSSKTRKDQVQVRTAEGLDRWVPAKKVQFAEVAEVAPRQPPGILQTLGAVARGDYNPAFSRYYSLCKNDLPNLAALSDFQYAGPGDDRTNCFAHALGRPGEWINPPKTVEETEKLLADHGFVPVDQPTPHRYPGFRQLKLFALHPDEARTLLERGEYSTCAYRAAKGAIALGAASPTHLVVEDLTRPASESGVAFTSKMGEGPVVRFWDDQLLSGGHYGHVERVYLGAGES